MDSVSTTELELIDLVETLDMDTLRSYFMEIMTASIEDDPNTQTELEVEP